MQGNIPTIILSLNNWVIVTPEIVPFVVVEEERSFAWVETTFETIGIDPYLGEFDHVNDIARLVTGNNQYWFNKSANRLEITENYVQGAATETKEYKRIDQASQEALNKEIIARQRADIATRGSFGYRVNKDLFSVS